ncbi:FkbM family methyltransferase [Burkholderia cepacia]|uniref:FkbM family methyltransferase n=1 Tax=Burkholderia cepacia TaxID=292 RepID=UPI001FC8D926|nr:FkbM family methyltransferase [Burkholderia cepacia]
MKLILHIGTEKTGSSSLQLTLAHQRDSLAAQGVWYSRVLGEYAHRKLSLYGRDSQHVMTDNRLATFGVQNPQQYEALCASIESDLQSDVGAAFSRNCRHFIVSCEYFSSLYRNTDETDRLAGMLYRHFDEIEVICFIRPQLDVLISRISTLACDGIEINESMIHDLAEDEQYFNFNLLLDRWASSFGRSSIKPIPYKRNRDTLAYLSNEIGIRIESIGLERINQSIDIESIALLNATRLSGGTLASVATYLKDFGATNKLSLSRPGRERLQLKFEASNLALCSKWPTIVPADLQPSDVVDDDAGNLHLLAAADRFAPQLRYVLERFQTEAASLTRRHTFAHACDVTLAIPEGHFAARYLQDGGLFRPRFIPVFERLLHNGHVVIDVGANIGFFSLLAARRVGPTGRVIAFDPSAKALAALLHASAINNLPNIEVHNTALYERFDTLAIVHNLMSTNCVVKPVDAIPSHLIDYSQLDLISAVQADAALDELTRCDLVKIAVGGNELPVIRGARRLLDRFKPVVLSEYSPAYQADVSGTTPDAYWQVFAELGYRCHLIGVDGQHETMTDLSQLLERYEAEERVCGGVTHLELCFDHPASSLRFVE